MELNKIGEFTVVLDEAQSVRPPLSSELKNLLAYAYDNRQDNGLGHIRGGDA